MKRTLSDLYSRDLQRLRVEIELLGNSTRLWAAPQGVSNSAGNLCLHLLGNLNHFIGATLGQTGYVRDREAEFSDKDIPAAELIRRIEALIPVIRQTLENLGEESLLSDYPLPFQERTVSTEFMLIHLYGHLNYHLGQINYLRRMTA